MKVIEEWSYPEEFTKEQVEADANRSSELGAHSTAIGYCRVIDAVLDVRKGSQTNNNYIKSESIIKVK